MNNALFKTLKKEMPVKLNHVNIFTDPEFLSQRRLIPKLQIFYNSLEVTKTGINNTNLIVSYRPNNCSYNLLPVTLRRNDLANSDVIILYSLLLTHKLYLNIYVYKECKYYFFIQSKPACWRNIRLSMEKRIYQQ